MPRAHRANPFLEPDALSASFPPFDRILPEHFREALATGMRVHLEEIEAIATNPAPPSFENTLVALERAGALLDRVSRTFWNLLSAHAEDALEAIAAEFSTRLAEHGDTIMLDARLFARVGVLYEARDELGLDEQSMQLLHRYHLDFERAGCGLARAEMERLRALNSELAGLSVRFGQNARKDAARLALTIEDAGELEGLSAAEIDAARDFARQRGVADGYLLPLASPTSQPALSVLARRSVRQKLLGASLSRGASGGEFDNRAVAARIASARAERARLLGFRNHADFVLSDTSAKSVERVNQFLGELIPRARDQVLLEAAELQALIEASGESFTLEAHDWAYYAARARRARQSLEEPALKPYLELESVLERGVFFAAQKLYGISFVARSDLPVYHPDVRVYEVLDADGSRLAFFLTDLYARQSKSGGAWSSQYVAQSELLGATPVIGNHLNIPKPAPGAPTLLSLAEVSTLFHEFGHALHAMFSRVRYPRLSGTNVAQDFVEFPSKFNEMWALWPEVIRNYGRHYETGAPIPEALLEQMVHSGRLEQGMATTEYLAATILDQAWHQIEAPVAPEDVDRFEEEALQRAGLLLPAVPPRYRTGYFSHIFDGSYAAGYYAYLWSEVLDADAGAWFRENGGLTRANGERLRALVLSRGGSADADLLFRRFRGRDAQATPMLLRRGLIASPPA